MSKNIYRVPYSIKKQIENELYQYWDNQKELEELEKDIIEESSSSDGQPRGNGTSDKTSKKALKIMSTRRIIAITRRLTYIDNAVNRLNKEEKEVFEIIFKEKYNSLLAETYKHIPKNTYYTVHRKIIYFTALEFGLI